MSFLRALRAYIGLGPDEDIEDRYLYELNSRRRELDLDELQADEIVLDEHGGLEIESDDVVIVAPGTGRAKVAGPGVTVGRSGRQDRSELGGRSNGGHGRSQNGRSSARPARATSLAHDLDDESGAIDLDFDYRDETDGDDLLDILGDPGPAEERSGRHRPGAHSAPRGRGPAREEVPSPQPVFDDGNVRSLDSMRAKPRTLIPESFADAKLVADEFKREIPVLLNLQGIERDLARRLIDFASGICYALDGSMEKVASQVFLLIPESVEVSDEDRRRIEERGYAR